MSAHASLGSTDDDVELAALRRRAFAVDADITDDPVALARLVELEERVRARFARTEGDRLPSDRHRIGSAHTLAPGTSSSSATLDAALPTNVVPDTAILANTAPAADAPLLTGATPTADAPPTAESRPATTTAPARRTARRHTALLTATAVAALALGGIAWSSIPSSDPSSADSTSAYAPAADDPPAAAPTIPVVDDQRWSTSSAAGYTEFLDHLRAEMLATPGLEKLSERIILDDLRPFGGLYGRKVWAGPTTDSEYCMIIMDRPRPSTGCISIEDASAAPLTIVLPAGYADSAKDAAVEPGSPVSYTLQPGGTVVAHPIAEPAAAETFPSQ